ncbi:hypothetical protein ACFV6E_15750 [Streptomyces sp. NPDC059785]|uniref:hypothetical protein n=1 Tax=unclassified Streptomyces TaxID=2593676 RepID=UPI00364D5A37
MTALRLLPWSGPDGKPAFLSTDDEGGFLSRVADEAEAAQLAAAEQVLGLVGQLVSEAGVGPGELRYAVRRLAECLTDALRVAESRGARLP